MAQGNLAVVLREQAATMEGAESARLLGEAVVAHARKVEGAERKRLLGEALAARRASLEHFTPESSAKADGQKWIAEVAEELAEAAKEPQPGG